MWFIQRQDLSNKDRSTGTGTEQISRRCCLQPPCHGSEEVGLLRKLAWPKPDKTARHTPKNVSPALLFHDCQVLWHGMPQKTMVMLGNPAFIGCQPSQSTRTIARERNKRTKDAKSNGAPNVQSEFVTDL